MGNYDFYVYQSPGGKWHFRILNLSDPHFSSSPSSALESQTDRPEGYDSKQAASTAALDKIETLP
jgi:hypothetical protein